MDSSRITWISDRALGAVVGDALAVIFDAEGGVHGPEAFLDEVPHDPEGVARRPVVPAGIVYPDPVHGEEPVVFSVSRIAWGGWASRLDIADLVVAAIELAPCRAVFATTAAIPAEAHELARRAHRDFDVELILVDGEALPELLRGRLPGPHPLPFGRHPRQCG